mmetsp:Transcript_28091/g.63537  ORF Transcript_28091/g.63537 Transcript_28091/m.63537 type:complete len:238 (-) Transcript_28091:1310-2023(-)
MGAGVSFSSVQEKERNFAALIRPWRIPNGYIERQKSDVPSCVSAGSKVFVRCSAPQALKLVEYFHFGVYLGRIDNCEEACVAQLDSEGMVKLVSLSQFCGDKTLFASTCASRLHLPDMIARARANEGKTFYNMVTCNCEHFASLCVENRFESSQVEMMIAKMECFLTGWYTDRQLGTSWQPRTSWRDVVGDHMALTCNAGLDMAKEYLSRATQRNHMIFSTKEIEAEQEHTRGAFVL